MLQNVPAGSEGIDRYGSESVLTESKWNGWGKILRDFVFFALWNIVRGLIGILCYESGVRGVIGWPPTAKVTLVAQNEGFFFRVFFWIVSGSSNLKHSSQKKGERQGVNLLLARRTERDAFSYNLQTALNIFFRFLSFYSFL